MDVFITLAAFIIVALAKSESRVIHSCPFENGWCNWIPDNGRIWRRISGQTSSQATGPTADHTHNNDRGYYAYAESSAPATSSTIADLTSQTLNLTRPACFTFWFHMRGDQMGILNVLQSLSGQERMLFQKQGNQGHDWLQGKVTMPNTGPYKIKFRAMIGSGHRSDMAIDDIMLEDGACIDYKPVGCFYDYMIPRRPFTMYIDLRRSIQWMNLDDTVENCAKVAKRYKSKVFALEFYGECWFKPRFNASYMVLGRARNKCWKNKVGRYFTMMVYKFTS